MTTEELWMKIDAKMSIMDGKLDEVATTVRLHEQALANDKKSIEAVKAEAKEQYNKLEARITKLERWMWFTLGAGGAAGAGIAKLLM